MTYAEKLAAEALAGGPYSDQALRLRVEIAILTAMRRCADLVWERDFESALILEGFAIVDVDRVADGLATIPERPGRPKL